MPSTSAVFAGKSPWGVDNADSLDWVWSLPKDSVHCVVTSPPYYGLRDYGCDGQIGLEKTPDQYVDNLVELFRGVRRALHPMGTLWLNLGDSYAAQGGSQVTGTKQVQGLQDGAWNGETRRAPTGLKPKDLMGIPWRVAFGLQQDGWYLRQACPWVKRNPMPESVTDRPSTACEMVFLLSKQPDYFFDMEAVRKKGRSAWAGTDFLPNSTKDKQHATAGIQTASTGASRNNRSTEKVEDDRNLRSGDLWFDSVGMLLASDGTLLGFDVSTAPYKGAHFAVMPEKLITPMILAGTSECGVCPHCGVSWTRIVEKQREPTRSGANSKVNRASQHDTSPYNTHSGTVVGNRDPQRHTTRSRTTGWEPGCQCENNNPVPAIVMDPFTGSGTVLAVARDRNRRAVGCELNPDYIKLAEKRIDAVIPGLL